MLMCFIYDELYSQHVKQSSPGTVHRVHKSHTVKNAEQSTPVFEMIESLTKDYRTFFIITHSVLTPDAFEYKFSTSPIGLSENSTCRDGGDKFGLQ